MTQSPPTPPPTSTTEIQDKARDSAAEAAEGSTGAPGGPSVVPTPSPIDAYQQGFTHICELALRRDFSMLSQYAELYDLKGRDVRDESRLLLVVPLVLAYLILDDPTPANFVLARLPESLLLHPLMRCLARLLASTSERNYGEVYSRAEALCALTQQPEFSDTTFARLISSMTASFTDSFRRRTFALLSQAFSSITTAQAQVYLGLTREDLLSAVAGSWQYDSASDTLHPPEMSSSAVHKHSGAPSSLDTFESVTNGLMKLGV